MDIKNGNKTAIGIFNTLNNPSLGCIQVDDAAYSTANWTQIDATTQFYEDCSLGIDNLSFYESVVWPNPTSSLLRLAKKDAVAYTVYSTNGKQVLQGPTFPSEGLDISGLKNGVYFLKLISAEGFLQIEKIIKK